MPGIDVDTGRENLGATGFLGMTGGARAAIKLGKAGYKIADHLGLLNIKAEPHAHSYQVLDRGKKLLNTSEIPDKLITLWKKSSDVVTEGPSVKGFRAVVLAVTGLWSSVQDTIELFYKNISPENAMLLEKIGGVMLEVGMSCLLWKDISDITKKTDKLDHLRRDLATAEALGSRAGDARAVSLRKYIHGLEAQRTNKMIKVAQWTSYFALGALIIAAAFFGVVLGPWMLLASTTALVLNIIGHFHNVHVVNPIFQDPIVGEEDLWFSPHELREYHKENWNTRDAREDPHSSTAGGVEKLPGEAEERLKTFYRNPGVREGLGWPAANQAQLAADV